MKFNPKFVSPVIMWLLAFAGVAAAVLWLPNSHLFSQGAIGFIVLGMGITNWLYLLFLGYAVHKSAPKSVAGIEKLVTTGVYSYLRHPMYAGDVVLAWSFAAAFPRFDVSVAAVWCTAVFLFWAALEDWALEEKFMDEYRSYRSRVPMVIPNFKKM